MLSEISSRKLWPVFRSKRSRATDLGLEAIGAVIPDVDADQSLQELNDELIVLASIFPDIRADVFRQMLGTSSCESRLHLVTEALLRNQSQLVRGRWRVSSLDGNNGSPAFEPVILNDLFRTSIYKDAVRQALTAEFTYLSQSSIRAVLAERNHSYTESRQILLELNDKSWRVSLTRVILRRKASKHDYHPLISWSPKGYEESDPILQVTSSTELNQELEETIRGPIKARKIKDQVVQDQALANQLNYEEAERENTTYDCECCFSPNSFENITTCGEGHWICFRCIRLSMSEAIFGQSWTRSIDIERATLLCVALSQSGTSTCNGTISKYSVRKALSIEDSGNETWLKFEEKLAKQELEKSGLPLARCAFCTYAEIDEYAVAPKHNQQRLWSTCCVAISLIMSFTLSRFLSTLLIIFAVLITSYRLREAAGSSIVGVIWSKSKIAPISHGRKFRCRNSRCQRISCLRCSASWHDIHICHSSSRQSLRIFVESAITDAIKRTCPVCGLSFVKSSGCNKLVCMCGYAMCYVCRADVRKEKYTHFCPHFRPDGGVCTDCNKCDLYKTEDEEHVVSRAKEQAEKEWWKQEGGRLDKGVMEEWQIGDINENGHFKKT